MISVIICAYNAEKFIDRCLESVFSQTYNNIEIVFVNDGSKDNTLKLAEEKLKGKQNCKIISAENRGVAAARNTALENATGDFILFLDADDAIDKECLEILRNSIENYDYAMMHSNVINEYKAVNQFRCDTAVFYCSKPVIDCKDFLKDAIVNGLDFRFMQFLYRKEIIDKYNARFTLGCAYAEDYEFLFKLFIRGGKIKNTFRNLYFYYIYSTSAMGSMSYKKFDALDVFLRISDFCKEIGENEFSDLILKIRIPNAVYTYTTDLIYKGEDFKKVYRFIKNGYTKYLKSYKNKNTKSLVKIKAMGYFPYVYLKMISKRAEKCSRNH